MLGHWASGRPGASAWATTGYLLAGLLGRASIGLFPIVAGLLACIGPDRAACRLGVIAAVVAVSASALIIGMALT